MGTQDCPPVRPYEDVDLDADTKESPEDVFCNVETEESPHKITLWYGADTAKPIVNHFPRDEISRQIGREITLGRHKTSDVLMYEPHMARSFATITCRSSAARNTGFFLRNACDASKQKRILVIDPKGEKTDILPTQEIELTENLSFRLECVTFTVSIDLGDMNARSFLLEVKSQGEKRKSRLGSNVEGPVTAFREAHVGLSMSDSVRQSSDQVVPKVIASAAPSLGRGIHPQIPLNAGAFHPPEPVMRGHASLSQYMPYVAPQDYLTGVQYSYHPNAVMMPQQVGYCEVPPSGPQYTMQYPQVRQSPPTHYNQYPLLERGGGFDPQHVDNTATVHNLQGPPPRGISMGELAQALRQVTSPAQTTSSTSAPIQSSSAIVTHPETCDRNPVLYPSPAQQKFVFPQPDGLECSGQLRDLPRGPPLGGLGTTESPQSVDLHPNVPSNRVTTHVAEESGGFRTDKGPVEHDDKI